MALGSPSGVTLGCPVTHTDVCGNCSITPRARPVRSVLSRAGCVSEGHLHRG